MSRGVGSPARSRGVHNRGTMLGFDPRNLGGLALWLDAGNVDGQGNSTLQDGAAVSSWKDLSGNGRDAAQATGSRQPLLRTASPNLLAYDTATFEIGTTGWAATGNSSIARSTAAALAGVAALAVTATAAATAFAGRNGQPVTAGQTYTFLVSSRAATTARGVLAVVQWKQADGTTPAGSDSSIGPTVNSTGGWTSYTVTGTAPAGAAFANLVLQINAPAAGEVHYFDNAGFFAGVVATWLPPVTQPNGQPCVQFDGVDDVLSGSALPVPAGSATWTTVVVACRDNTTLAALLFTERASLSTPIVAQVEADLGGRTMAGQRNDANTLSRPVATTATGGAWAIHEGVDDGTTITALTNGAGAASASTATGAASVVAFGVGAGPEVLSTGNQFTALAIAAVLVFSRALSVSERQQVEAYLKTRFGTP